MKHYGAEEHALSSCGEGSRIGMFVDLDSPTLLPVLMALNFGTRGTMQELKRLLEEKCVKEIGLCR
jgi:hypothetical protein